MVDAVTEPAESAEPDNVDVVPAPAGDRRPLDPAVMVLAALVFIWIVVFGRLVWVRYDRFGAFGFDMAIFDQATWLLSRLGGQFITVRGLPVFGHHANVALYLLVPFYWLGAGPQFLNLLQVCSLAAGAVPVFLLARYRLANAWLAVALAAAYLLHPSLQFMAWELFHPDAMAILPLLLAYWFSVRERWGWFAVCAVLAVLWKEDVALATLVLGLVIFFRGHRRAGLTTAGLSLGWFLFVSRVMLPHFSGTEAFYLSFFSDLGKTPLEMVGNGIRHPTLITRRVTDPTAGTYFWKMVAPFGFVPLLAPAILLIGVPQYFVNVLSVNDFTRKITFHYAALVLAALILATVEGIAWASRSSVTLRQFLVGFVAACALAATLTWGPSPIGAEFHKGWWQQGADPRLGAKRAAMAVVPADAAVSATYLFDSHLTHRERIYEYPNPFKPSNWGVADENYPRPEVARWLAVDTEIMGPEDHQIFDQLIGDGEFVIRFQRQGIVVAERVRSSDGSPLGAP